jgi:Lhr-like helicase
MSCYNWQKSSYSGEAANCINVAAATDASIRLRESDAPDTIITTTPESLKALIHSTKANGSTPPQAPNR